MSPAYHGRFLRVDLSRGRLTDERVPDEWMRDSLGGRGFGARIVLRDVPPDADPLDGENVLTFMGGPLTGYAVGGAGRHAVHARSPLTGLLGESFVGGFFGTEMCRTGYDGFIFTGRAEHPAFLSVVDGQAELNDASNLWRRTVSRTEEALLERFPKARVASIGPAGEKLVRFASIMNDRNRAAGRTGMGAVMGSKGLKAVVVRGKSGPELNDPAAFREARLAYTRTIAPEKDGFGVLGTSGGVAWLSDHGILPTRNWQAGAHPQARRIDGQTLADTILVKRDTCTACPVACKRVVETTLNGERVAGKHGGPEYETLAAWGSLQDVPDLDYVAAANKWCNEYGLDTISAGSVIAHCMEAVERGLLPWTGQGAKSGPEHHEPGVLPRFGDPSGGLDLLHMIARREGIGDDLAEGVKRFSEKHGTQGFAMHVKGAELPMHEPRGKKALGLSYACTFRGANHMDGLHDTELERPNAAPDVGVTERVSRFSVEGKARLNKIYEDGRSFTNSLVLCAFDAWEVGADANIGPVAAMVSAATGFDVDREAAFRIGERNFQLARLASCRFGLDPATDDLPTRIKEEALPFGTRDGERHERLADEDLALLKREYYALRGWGRDGAPTRDALSALGLRGLA